GAIPFLQCFFAADGTLHGFVLLIPDQCLYAVSTSESLDYTFTMLPYPLYKIGCDTDVECAIGFAAQQVDGGLFHAALLCLPVWVPAVAAMTVWALGMTVWALRMTVWALGMTVWALGMTVWALGVTAWALGMTVWALRVTAWALGMTVWALRMTVWALGMTAW